MKRSKEKSQKTGRTVAYADVEWAIFAGRFLKCAIKDGRQTLEV